MKKSMEVISVSILLFSLLLIPFFYNFQTHALMSANVKVSSQGIIVYNNATVTPLVGGWGGIPLCEVNRYTNVENAGARNTPPSAVFAGEVASNAEMAMIKLKADGYNAVRVLWQPPGETSFWDSLYNQTYMARCLSIAIALDLTVIVDCHVYYQQYQYTSDWLSQWKTIIQDNMNSAAKIIWEPCNEPTMSNADGSNALSGQAAVDTLSTIYQSWIDQCRGLGDTHWIVVSAVCWWNSLPPVDWFPNVTDPMNRVFLNYHYYYFYDYHANAWTVQGAQSYADSMFNIVQQAITKYNRPFLCTELGAHPGTFPPDLQYNGASGYSPVSLAFVQRLITDFDNYPSRIGYFLWAAGDWAKDWSDGWHYLGLYGGMDVWGQLLQRAVFR